MTEHVSLLLNGIDVEVVGLRGREALGELFTFEVRCAWDARVPEPRGLVRADAVLTLRCGSGERTIRGIVRRAERQLRDPALGADGLSRADEAGEFEVVVVPPAFELTLGRNSRTFRDVSVMEIVDVVLGELPHRWELVSRYRKRDYCAQYREDDWTFVTRLLEDEGIHLWFDHADGSSLVFSDSSVRAHDLTGGALLPFAVDTGQSREGESVHELFGESAAIPNRFAVRSFDPRRPTLRVEGASGSGPIEHYDAPGAGPREPAEAARRAQLSAEAAAVKTRMHDGASNSVRLAPGRALEVSGHPLSRYDIRYLIVEATHAVTQRRRDATSSGEAASESSYGCRFRAIPASLPFRPSPATSQALQAGLQSGVVVGAPGEEIHPDPEGRVRVQFHWDREGQRDDKSGHWMRVAQRGTADSMLLPRIGWNVITFNEEGSVDEPSVLSRIHDAEHPPSHGLPDNQTRVVFGTATSPADGTSNEIYYEDTKGAEEMHWRASLDMSSDTQNNESWVIGNDHTRAIANERRLAVGTDAIEAVDGDQQVSIGGNEMLTVLAKRTKTIGIDETETIAGRRNLHVGASHVTHVDGSRSLRVGTALIDVTLGPITSSAGMTHKIMVGGAAVKLTAKSMAEDAGLGALQTIGGAKLEITKGARAMSAKVLHAETVGGVMVHKTAGGWTNSTKIGTKMSVGGLLAVGSPTLTIVAKAKIVLRCGGSTVTITPSSVIVAAPALDVDDASVLDAVSGRVDHN